MAATGTPGRLIRTRDREWTIQRVGGYLPWQVTHLPTRITFHAGSESDARRRITTGHYARKIADKLRPTPPTRRDWWQDPIRGVWHLWTGGIADWTCWVHRRVCSPTAPITGDDILRLAVNDPAVGDDMFVMLRQAVEGRPIDLHTVPKEK